MAKVPLQKEQEAFNQKTIQPNNWFIVNFPDTLGVDVKNWMVTDISIQEPVEFQKVGFQVQGRPFSRPVMKENDGYEFTITMEETKDWKVSELVNELEIRNIDQYGIHRYWSSACIGDIRISVLSPKGYTNSGDFDILKTWIMSDSFFVRSDGLDFSYNSPGKIIRKLTFCCNQIIMDNK